MYKDLALDRTAWTFSERRRRKKNDFIRIFALLSFSASKRVQSILHQLIASSLDLIYKNVCITHTLISLYNNKNVCMFATAHFNQGFLFPYLRRLNDKKKSFHSSKAERDSVRFLISSMRFVWQTARESERAIREIQLSLRCFTELCIKILFENLCPFLIVHAFVFWEKKKHFYTKLAQSASGAYSFFFRTNCCYF